MGGRILPREVDPLVYNMTMEDPGGVSFASLGGLGDQIRELREVRCLSPSARSPSLAFSHTDLAGHRAPVDEPRTVHPSGYQATKRCVTPSGSSASLLMLSRP